MKGLKSGLGKLGADGGNPSLEDAAKKIKKRKDAMKKQLEELDK